MLIVTALGGGEWYGGLGGVKARGRERGGKKEKKGMNERYEELKQ